MTADAEPQATPTPFNFSRAGMVANDQVRTLRTLDEQFARNLTHTLGAWLRTSILITPQPAEQALFGQFMERTTTGRYVQPLMLQPLQVRGAMAMSLALAPAIIDMLLGGSGRVAAQQRDLTEIEEAVLGSVLDLVMREWCTAWAPLGLEFATGMRERDSHNQRLMPLQERVFLCRFQVTLGELTGELMFCMPSSAVTATLRSFTSRRDSQRQRTAAERAGMAHRMRSAGLQASLHFPPMRLRADQLRALQPGSLLTLPLPRGVPAELRVGGVAVFRAEPVRSGEHRAARIVHPLETNDTAGGHAA